MGKAEGRPLRLKKDGVDTDEVAIDGGRRMRVRRRSVNDITPEQVETFLSTLAETCNVVRSAKAAGFAANWAYRKRRTDAAFRAGWMQAVAEGYAKLELVLLERAMNGTVKRVPMPKGGERRIREYSNTLAIALLKRHADTADQAQAMISSEEVEEARERILAKLKRIRKRVTNRDGPATGEGTDEAPGDGAR